MAWAAAGKGITRGRAEWRLVTNIKRLEAAWCRDYALAWLEVANLKDGEGFIMIQCGTALEYAFT